MGGLSMVLVPHIPGSAVQAARPQASPAVDSNSGSGILADAILFSEYSTMRIQYIKSDLEKLACSLILPWRYDS